MSRPDDERDTEYDDLPEDDTSQEEESEEESEEEGSEEEFESGSPRSETDDDDDEELDPKRLLNTVRNQRKAEKAQAKRIKELERENKQFKRGEQSRDEQLASDLEEKGTRITELEGENEELHSRVRRSDFVERIGVRNARIAWKVLDEVNVEPQFDENDRLKNPKAVRKALLEYDSEMFRDATGSADGGPRDRSAGESSGSMNDLIRGVR